VSAIDPGPRTATMLGLVGQFFEQSVPVSNVPCLLALQLPKKRLCDGRVSRLVAQSRYDKPKLGKLRKDWLIYMEMLETSRTSNFLSLESRDEAAREKHGRQAEEEKVQLVAIEDAFAEAIGPEAVEKLREIRAKTWDSFSDEGELGVEGQYRIPSYLLRQIERVRSPPSHHEET